MTMDPRDYDGREWTALLQNLTTRQLRNGVKRSYRKAANEAREIAVRRLRSSGLDVQGNRGDWERGIRTHIYSRGGGFLVTVKARAGKAEKGMHSNRRGLKKPVLQFAEEGTAARRTKSNSGRHMRTFMRRLRRGHSTGSMPAYKFLSDSTPEMFRKVEQVLFPVVETEVMKSARKAGLI